MSNNQIEEAIQETKKELNKLKPCKHCIYAANACTWCTKCGTKINPYQYGCRHFMTNEDAIRKIAEEEYRKYCAERAKTTLELDIMGYTINAASIMLEKIDKDIERSYASIKEPTDESLKNRAKSKQNRDRLRKAYAEMKYRAQDIRNTYDRYIEYFFTHQFTDEKGNYNGFESDKNLANSGVITKFIKMFVDRCLDNQENAEKILAYISSLPGSGYLSEHDFNNGIIRK